MGTTPGVLDVGDVMYCVEKRAGTLLAISNEATFSSALKVKKGN